MELSRVKWREALKPRREPYWQRLRPGAFLGYRPSAKLGPGTWIARAYDEDQRNYRTRALGSFGDYPANERFALAKADAEKFAGEVEHGGLRSDNIETVEDACKQFARSHNEAGDRFRRYVYADPIARIKLAKLRRSHLKSWRQRLEDTPALVSRRKNGQPVTRARSPATLNRDMAVLRTALGQVLPLGPPNTDAAWQEALKPVRNAVKRRTLFLNRDQRRLLLASACNEARFFIEVLNILPLRPGAIAGLVAGDFDKRTAELTIGKDKAGNGRRIVLPVTAARLFAAAARGKLPGAPLFTRSNGKAWDKENWNNPIHDAARKAKLPAGVTAYTLRHSVITDLVAGGLPLLTVAQISGTSAAMIEKHYGHLVADAATKALAELAL